MRGNLRLVEKGESLREAGCGVVILGGSWDLVSIVISALIGDICNYKYSFRNYFPIY